MPDGKYEDDRRAVVWFTPGELMTLVDRVCRTNLPPDVRAVGVLADPIQGRLGIIVSSVELARVEPKASLPDFRLELTERW